MSFQTHFCPVLSLSSFGVSDFQGGSNSFFPSPGTPMALKLLPKASTKLHTFLYEYCVALSLATHPAIIGMFGIAIESSQYYGFLYEPAMHKDLISIIKPRVSAATKAWELGLQCLASADWLGQREKVNGMWVFHF